MPIECAALSKQHKQYVLLRLLQLNSPALPVGSYAYSQGLEWAVEARWINNAQDLERWLKGLMHSALGQLDIPIMKRLHQAWLEQNFDSIKDWNAVLLAYRETAEIRKEELDKGYALAELLKGLQIAQAALIPKEQPAFLTVYCCAAVAWEMALQDTAQGYLWGWLENQVVSAMKIMPLGQLSSQKILHHLVEFIPEIVEHSLKIADEDIGLVLPAQAIACAQHETQYTRLFRS